MKMHIVALSLAITIGGTALHALPLSNPPMSPQKMVVSVPVADVRREPKAPRALGNLPFKLPLCSNYNPLQETQVLYGEHLLALEERDGWIRIIAMEQQKNRDGHWVGYPGWIRKNQAIAVDTFPQYNLVVSRPWATLYDAQHNATMQVSIGTKLRSLSTDQSIWTVALPDGTRATIAATDVYPLTLPIAEDETTLRNNLIARAPLLESALYCWGGRSAQSDQLLVSSFDCAGLINTCYRSVGLDIPRNSNDILLQTVAVPYGKAMQPGDLIFTLRPERPTHVTHIMMYLGNERLLETTFSISMRREYVDRSRIVTVEHKIGTPMAAIIDGKIYGDYIVILRSLLATPAMRNKLRAQALRTTYDYGCTGTTK